MHKGQRKFYEDALQASSVAAAEQGADDHWTPYGSRARGMRQ